MKVKRTRLETELTKGDISLNVKKRNLPFLLLSFVIIVFYSILWYAYYKDLTNAFIFVGAILVGLVITLISLFIYRNDKSKIGKLSWITIILALLLCFEIRLLWYESYTYTASFHSNPIEAFDNSGINLMFVRTFDIEYVEDEELIIKSLQQENLDIIDLYKLNNKIRYGSKNNELLQLLRIQKDSFSTMAENVKRYLRDDTSSINEFLNSNDISGDSAGLGLALTGLIAQGKLENDLTFGVTGTLNATGDVNSIGMIKEKLLIAEEEAYPFMIIPSENAAEASEVKVAQNLNLEIFDVNHINQAIIIIKELNEEHSK